MIELIPAIDLIGGKCVRLTKGDYDTQKVYNEDPVAVAREFEEYGFKRLHVVDLDGARSKHVVNHKVLERMAQATNLVIDFGGGIKTDEDIRIATESGAQMVTVGSVAVTQPELFLGWLQQLGSERIILGADVKNGRISINGWKEDSSDELIPFLDKYIQKGVQKVLCTEISKDGTLQGPATALYREIMTQYPQCHLIASGGVSSMNDLKELDQADIPAVVFGKAIYEGRIALKDLALWMEKNR
ncbi:1-(5-phosphoribosyl)-5-[(5-phosphoribosylamino)methylideneamino]imidazole-4-carboxamide isomerase [Bacteroides sp. OF04-15BH]|uniref:1-(5-phosphoribosyl)-5-[(5- phosphoribosylamino)methylideneamino]imidazole-4- carboxamide isomerase n=1 Tax=Bacteroides sp. OF04-15BH TaxID=2292281 RepID=UPI000E4D2927|nr:1-(5-phosphoribosyl)-5-[(5-phosphoribosylamino)methylideneamino]imidazole-4-carboxamide isomerase [Bacteroides sp. OF04-15BH]RHP64586.1 1-(5-phosphoribosyl)-5-[(5-phosphoribosylamino)methylideneamino]imidazole-4-carboxamide isomerase [Bacteroides sp. OF04-15BH]